VQKGSLVNAEHLRFDFSHFAKLTEEEIKKIETIVNDKIRENLLVTIQFLPKDEALQLGAMALFGEKYGSTVRVVSIGKDFSIELCGGTHAQATGELGFFKITSEGAVAAGVRRIEAVSGKAAEIFINNQLNILNNIKQTLKQPKDIEKSVQLLIENQAILQQEKEALEERLIQYISKELLQSHVQSVFKNTKFISALVELASVNALKKLCFNIKKELPRSIILIGAIIDSKPQIALAIDEEIAKEQQWNASKIIKEQLAPVIKGGGGGQAFFATAGGQDASQLVKLINNPPFLSTVNSKM
jgi:alanyl-tRNA synthetase